MPCVFAVDKITEGISYVAKQSAPSVVASVQGVRKAMGVSIEPLPVASDASSIPSTVSMETDQRDIENELSKLLGEDGVSDVMTDIFH